MGRKNKHRGLFFGKPTWTTAHESPSTLPIGQNTGYLICVHFCYLAKIPLPATLRLQPHTRHTCIQSLGQVSHREQSRLMTLAWKRRRERIRHLCALLIDDYLQSALQQLPTPPPLQTTLTSSIVNQIERIPHRRPALNRGPPQSDAAVPIHHLLRFRLARQPPVLQVQMRQLMHQIVTLVPDQGVRLA